MFAKRRKDILCHFYRCSYVSIIKKGAISGMLGLFKNFKTYQKINEFMGNWFLFVSLNSCQKLKYLDLTATNQTMSIRLYPYIRNSSAFSSNHRSNSRGIPNAILRHCKNEQLEWSETS